MKVLLLFFCSGATALVYEVLWSKYLSRLLGSTVQAQTIVLAVFMGGLALGNRLFGQRADLLRRPLTGYGWIEIAIGVYAFFFPYFYQWSDSLFVAVGTPIADQSWLLLILKAVLSTGLLILPTVLMGGTLPLLAGWLQARPGQHEGFSKNAIGIFYGVNSLGAVFGSGLAGFFLIQNFGTVSSLQLTAFFNVLIGVVALGLGKRDEPFGPRPIPVAEEEMRKVQVGALGGLVALTGGISMGMEVLAARSLALVVGGSLQAFAIVLMAFILGIGLGSLVISSWRYAHKEPARVIFGLLIGAGTLVGLYVIFIQEWVILYSKARFGLAANEYGFIEHQLLVAMIALVVLGLPASLLGAVLPLCMRLVSGEGVLVANKVGRLLTANTLGAVAGVILTGFVLMPVLGLRPALGTVSLSIIGLALVIATTQKMPKERVGGAGIGIALLVGMLLTGEGWQHVVGSGIYRLRNAALSKHAISERKKSVDILYYKDGADATVSIEDSGTGSERQRVLRINGKADASTQGDLSTQYLLAHLSLAAKPGAKEVFVFGFGSGITAGATLGHPIEHVTIAENCQPVLEGAPLFSKWNRGVLTNARTIIRKEDARTVLKLSPPKFDVIISEPSNPWVAGIGSVFSKEFYEVAASKLTEGGVMAQWFHIYEMNDGIVSLVVRTFSEVFPYLEIWDSQQGDIILLGSKKPWPSNAASYQKLFELPGPKSDLETLQILTPIHLWARQISSQKTGFAVAGDGPIQSDEFPVLEYAAPMAFFIGFNSERLFSFDERTHQSLLAPADKIAAMKAIPEASILNTFSTYPPANRELETYMRVRLDGAAKGTAPGVGGDPLLPVLFRPPESHLTDVPQFNQSGLLYAELLRAEASLLAHPEDWEKHVSFIGDKLLHYYKNRNLLTGQTFRPSYYAAIAARNFAARGRYPEAISFLEMGFEFDPQDLQLHFLARLIFAWAPHLRNEEGGEAGAMTNVAR